MNSDPQSLHRSVFEGDNLHVLRGINSESVDLIYLDPPFNSNRTYSAPIGSKAAGAAFKDAWTLSDVDLQEHNRLKHLNPTLYALIYAAGKAHSKGMFSYLMMMAPRLLECHRLLKSTGSLYLHCDPTASHYLKFLLDGIFRQSNCLNEIVWYYRGAGVPKYAHARRHDILLWYAKQSGQHVFNPDPIRQPYAEATQARFSHYIGNVRGSSDYGQQKLNPLGKHPDDVITNIQPIAPSAKARLGYPTQKPIALLERVIKATSNEGDLVLDPFCGCATTMVGAEFLNRKWVGIDLSPKAAELVVQRIQEKRNLFQFKDIHRRQTIPIRTDIERRKASTLSERKALKDRLYVEQEGLCNLCHGEFDYGNMEMDHIFPKAKGGQDWVDNFQLLCPRCNKLKKTGTQEEARARLVEIRGIDFTPFDSGPTVLPIPRAAEKTATYRGQKTHSD